MDTSLRAARVYVGKTLSFKMLRSFTDYHADDLNLVLVCKNTSILFLTEKSELKPFWTGFRWPSSVWKTLEANVGEKVRGRRGRGGLNMSCLLLLIPKCGRKYIISILIIKKTPCISVYTRLCTVSCKHTVYLCTDMYTCECNDKLQRIPLHSQPAKGTW